MADFGFMILDNWLVVAVAVVIVVAASRHLSPARRARRKSGRTRSF
jgi:hypothetical protein